MDQVVVLLYGVLIFMGTVVASIPFGIVRGFKQARGIPVPEHASLRLRMFEWLLEACAVILVTADLGARRSTDALLHALAAYLVASLISFVLEVRSLRMPPREFVWRMLLGLVICLPAGLSIGLVSNARA